MRREELALLNSYGIAFDAAMGLRLHLMEDEESDLWGSDITIAMDAQPQLITVGNAGIPAYLTNLLDPEVVRVLTAPMKAAEIFGETKKGDWVTFSTQFPVIESTGEVSSYGDHSNNGRTGVNANWVPRQSYHYQTITEWGERETEQYGLAKINYASEQNVSSALILSKFQNKTYFYGVAGLQLYGALNDPSLPAAITPTTKAAGGYTWAVATMNEIYQDVLKMFRQLQTQMVGLVPDRDAKMTLALSPGLETYLLVANTFAPGFTAGDLIRTNFPGLTIKTAPEYATQAGELAQLFLDNVDGIRTTYSAFTEKMRAHAVIQEMSAWKQKKSGGTWGTIWRRPIAVVQMIGM